MVIPDNLEFIPLEGGQLAERIHDTDWTNTSLGQPIQWDPLLKTMVSTISMNPKPMLLCWGNKLEQISNDAFIQVFGEIPPGKPLRSSLSQSWEPVWAAIETVMSGRTVNLVRQPLYLGARESEFDISLIPIQTAEGTAKGIILSLQETGLREKANFSGEQLRQAIEAVELATFDYNPQTNRFTANSRLKKWFGLPPEAEIDLSLGINAIAQADQDRVTAAIKRTLEPDSGGLYSIRYNLYRRDIQEMRKVHARGKAWFDRDGIPFRFTGTLQDVSEQIKAEEAKANFDSLIELSDEFVAFIDEAYRITYLNPAALKMLGWHTPGNRAFSDLFQPEDTGELDAITLELESHGKFRRESRLHSLGEDPEIWLQWNGLKIYDAVTGTPSYALIGANITERKKVEEKVKLSEKKLRLMILQAPMAIAIFRGNDFITEIANKSALEIWGRNAEEIIEKPIIRAIPEVEKQGIPELLDNVMETGNRYATVEQPIEFYRDGKLQTRYISFSYEPLYNLDGVIDRVMAIGVDVTPQVRARMVVEANEEKLNLIIDATELGTWTLDLETNAIDCSDRCLDIFGLPPSAKPTREELLDLYPEKERKERDLAMAKALENGKLYYKSKVQLKDGRVKWIEVMGKMFHDENGNPDRFMGTTRDITKATIAQKELEEREAKFRLLADSMPQFVWTADADGSTRYFNRSMVEYTGLPEHAIQNDGWLKFIHPEDREGNYNHWMHCTAQGIPYLYEHRFQHHDGSYRWFLTRALPQYSEEGEIIRWVGTSTDIQEHKISTQELERKVEQRTSELKEKNNALKKMNQDLKSFTYISSHDLQEPLRKIRMFSGMLMEREFDKLSDSGKNKFRRIERSAKRMQMLLEDLLEYSRTSKENTTLEHRSLQEILAELQENYQEEIDQEQLELNCNNDVLLKVIPYQFQQVLLNLISNSLKFSKPGEATRVDINCRKISGGAVGFKEADRGKTYFHIHYQDHGIGFDPGYEKKIFEVFQRLHTKEKFEGTGMGLAIVKKIIDNHHGFIKAEGSPGKGAAFDIYLPS